jgi:hypothetical protein
MHYSFAILVPPIAMILCERYIASFFVGAIWLRGPLFFLANPWDGAAAFGLLATPGLWLLSAILACGVAVRYRKANGIG